MTTCLQSGRLSMTPRVPADWDRFDVLLKLQGKEVRIGWRASVAEELDGEKPGHVVRAGDWIDLQLPLYRYLLTSIFPECREQIDTIQMGYVLLPKTTSDIRFDRVEWSPDDLRQADELAHDVIRKIVRQEFWPLNIQPPEFSEQFAAICHDHIFESGVQQ